MTDDVKVVVHIPSVDAFMAVSFAAQVAADFPVREEHPAAIGHLRSDPIIPMYLVAVIIQGILKSLAVQELKDQTGPCYRSMAALNWSKCCILTI